MAVATMASLTMEITDKKVKKSQVIGSFLQPHALGLAARFGELVTDSHTGVRISLRERRQCLLAMEEMIRVSRSYMCIARPQVSASSCRVASIHLLIVTVRFVPVSRPPWSLMSFDPWPFPVGKPWSTAWTMRTSKR